MRRYLSDMVFTCAGVQTKHATYQIVLPIIYVYSFKGKFRAVVGVDG